jgi:predicted nucleic acid-binding protein
MSDAERFFDSNVLLYLLSSDTAKADRAESLISLGGHISVQVLNEFAAVATRKSRMNHAEIRDVLAPIRAVCTVHPLSLETHDCGLQIAERYRLSIYDAMIVAAAQLAGCKTLFTEDLQHGMRIGRSLRIHNPFAQ